MMLKCILSRRGVVSASSALTAPPLATAFSSSSSSCAFSLSERKKAIMMEHGSSTTTTTRGISSSSSSAASEAALRDFKGKHLLSIGDLSNDELRGLLDLSKKYKSLYGRDSTTINNPLEAPKPLLGQSVSMIFQKRSTRTRVSTETGMYLLGGHSLFLGPSDVQLGVNETMKDTALVLSRYNSIILARVYGHSDVLELSTHATVPVINALSDMHHPLQTLADLMVLEEHYDNDLKGKTLSWVGDGNNIIHDLMIGSLKLGMNVNVATPQGYPCHQPIVDQAKIIARDNNATLKQTSVAEEAVIGADVVVTDTWVSMGQEDEYEKRLKDFDGYQVDTTLMSKANDGAVFLHCLPRHPEEVTDDVIYSKQSLVFQEAENRMWTVMAVMAAQLGKTGV